jgi:hypothetical protein
MSRLIEVEFGTAIETRKSEELGHNSNDDLVIRLR